MEQKNVSTSSTIMNPIQVPNEGGDPVNILGIPMLIRIPGRDIAATAGHPVCAEDRE